MRPHFRSSTAGGTLARLLPAVLLALAGPLTAVLFAPAPAEAAPRVAPVPSVSLVAPGTVFLGSAFNLTVTFDNTSASDVGYGPFIDLIFPVNGADGAAGTDTPDGIDFTGATYLGATLTATELTFPDSGGGSGCVNHPYARDTSGAYLQVCGTAGDKLVVLELPFGSFTPTQPAAVVTVGATLSNLADLGTPLTILARGGFRFGSTPLDDWCCDPVILLPAANDGTGWPDADVTPTLITIAKTYSGPEDETATGPNFPRQYTITVTIPSGQTVTDLDVTDELPNNIAFLSSSPAPSLSPPAGVPSNPPNNRLVVNFPTVTGTATVTVSFFVPLSDADGNRVIAPDSGNDVTSPNRAGAVGDWTPIDPRDAGGTDNAVAGGVCPACGILHTLNDRSIAVQKGVTIVGDTGAAGASPGDTLEYSLQFQISDFFAFDGVALADTISDGQRFDSTFTPTLSVSGNGFTLAAAAMAAANFDVTCNYTGGPGPECTLDDGGANNGQTTLTFRASDELVTRGQATGRFVGGCIPPGGAATPDCDVYNDGPTTGTIVFRTLIQDEFTDTFPSGDESVDQGDVLNDTVTVAGRVLTTATFSPTGQTEDDGSAASVTIARGSPTKTIYAVNGTICPVCTNVEVDPGDTLTFRLQYDLPTSDFEDLSLADFLPLPVLYATEVTTFDATVDGAAPPAGTAKFGPADTFYGSRPGFSDFAPTITTDPVGNSVTFTYGDYDDPTIPPPSTTIDILFTVTVSNDPFTDRLLLTNQLRVHEGSTNATDQDDDGIVQFTLREPFLAVRKGVIATDAPAGTFNPAATGPVVFSPPGSANPRWSGTIDSNGLTANPVDSDLSGVDATDLVSFAITIENLGSSPSGAFDIVVTDTPQPGFITAGGPLNLSVTLGDGSPVSVVAGGDLFGAGIELVDPGLGVGVCEAHAPTGGRNIIVITYDLQVDPSAEPSMVITNTAEVIHYAGEEGGEDHTGSGPNPAFQDEADVTIASPTVVKTVLGTNQAHTSGLSVAIGEQVQYQAVITLPEGTSTSVTLVDTLDSGLAFVSLDSLTASGALSTDVAGGFPQVLTNAQAALAAPGSSAAFAFGTVTNSDTDDSAVETITVTYTVVVLNSPGNDRGIGRNNAAVWTWSEGSVSGSAPNVVIVEPTLQVTKTALPTTGDAGDTITFTVAISHAGASNADAFEVTWSDVIPAGMTYTPGTLAFSGGTLAPSSLDDTGAPTLTATWTVLTGFPLGSTSTLTFDVTLDGTVSPGQVITNTANVAWTSLPADVTTPQSAYNGVSTERTGDVAHPGGVQNDYRATGTATVTVTSTPTKSIRLTSEAHTAAVSGIERVAVGEIIRYRLQLQLPEGTATSFQLQDVLPAGLFFLDDNTATAALVSNGGVPPAGGISSSTLPATDGGGNPLAVAGDQTTVAGIIPLYVLPDNAVSSSIADSTADNYIVGSGTDPVFWFGDLVNFDRDIDQEFVLVEFNALVENILGNQTNTLRSNQFRPRVAGVNGTLSNILSVRVAEPTIANLAKKVTTTPDDAGDLVTYSLTYGNTSTGANAAAAFDIRLLDTLDSNLELQGVVVTAPGYAVVTDNSSLVTDVVDVMVSRLNPSDSVTITVTAQVIDTAAFGAVIPNSASLTYTSLPGANGTTPNPTGSTTPGAAGSGTGERDGSGSPTIGSLNDYFDSGSASVSLNDPAVSKSIFATSVTTTGSGEFDPSVTDLIVGETVSFRITATLPEGDGPIAIVDDLPTVPDGVLGVVSSQVVSIGSSLTTSLLNVGDSGVAADVNVVDGIDDRVTFDFGAVHNQPDGGSDADDQIVVEVVARLENVAANQNGDSLINTATLDFGTGTQTATASVEVVEPELTLTKAADDDTPAFGQTVTFTVTVAHGSGSAADAFDLVITDTIPAGLSYVSGSASLPPGQVDESGDPTIEFTIPSLALASGSTSFTYEATVAGYPAVSLGDTLTNSQVLEWTSITGSDTGERDGSGGVNDYTASASETVTVSGPDLRITKDDGGIVGFPGGTIAYTLAYTNVGNTAADGVVISDTIPANTTFNAGASTAGWSCPGGTTPGNVCTISLGTVAAGGSGSVTFALTVDDPLAAGVTQVSNTASMADDGAHGPEPTPTDNTDSDTTPVTAVPDLTISKDDGQSIVGQGTILTYTLNYSNAGDQDATGVVLTETVPVGTTFTGSGWACAPDNTAGSTCTYNVGDLPASGGGSVAFVVTVDNPVAPGVTQVVNTVTIADDGTNGPDANPADNTDTDTDNLLLGSAFAKTLISTNQGHTAGAYAAIGEQLRYQIVVTVPPGTATGVSIRDDMDLGLAFVDCVSLTPSSNGLASSAGSFAAICDNPTVSGGPPTDPSDGGTVTFDLGDVTNTDASAATLTLTYDAVALDSAGNVRGVSLANAATLAWDSGSLEAGGAAVDLVEPTLALTKNASPTVALPGSEITFALTVDHGPVSDSTAFDLVLTDVVPAGLTYVPGSLNVTTSQSVPPATDDSGAPTLRVSWASFEDTGAADVITFRATLGNLSAGDSVTNTVLLQWTSLPGDVSASQSAFNDLSTERFYDPGDAVNIYGVSASATVAIPSLPATGFAPDRVTSLPEQPADRAYADLGGLRLEIPAQGVDIPIVGVPRGGEGWDLTWLANAAGYLEGTAFPTLSGNSAITGHVYLADGTPGPFARLDDILWGDEIWVVSGEAVFVYSVRQVSHVHPDNLNVLRHEDQPWLTLITCEGFDEAREAYARRIVVRAVLVEVRAR